MPDLRSNPKPDPIDAQVGLTIRQRRKDRGLSQAQLGAALGVSFQQVQKYECGVDRISASMLVRTAMALDVQPSELLPRTDAKPPPPPQAAVFAAGAEEVAEIYAPIPSVKRREALLVLVRAMGRCEAASEQASVGDVA